MIDYTYTPQEVAAAMRSAGFDEAKIREGVAIVTAESGRRSHALNDSPGQEYSVGPWQINLMAHPKVTVECARDLACSTREAFRISGGGESWNPWGAFTNGSYRRYLDLLPEAVSSATGAARKALQEIADAPVGPVGPQGGETPSVGCRTFSEIDLLRAVFMRTQGSSVQAIAEALGVSLACLKERVGEALGNIEKAPIAGGAIGGVDAIGKAAEGARSATERVGELLAPESLWRVAIVGAGLLLVLLGVRLYMHQPPVAPATREG